MKSFFSGIFLLFFLFSLSLQAEDKNTILMDEITRHFNRKGLNYHGINLQEKMPEASDAINDSDVKAFHELLNNFHWQILTEQYLNTGCIGLALETVGATFGAASYGLSYLPSLPDCMRTACEKGYNLCMAGGKYFCVSNKSDVICLKFIAKTFGLSGEDLAEHAFYTPGCAPGLASSLTNEPTRIAVGQVIEESWPLCETFGRSALALPAFVAGGTAALFAAIGTTKISYDVYLSYALKKLAKHEYENGAEMLNKMLKKYPQYSPLITFLMSYLIEKNEETNLLWGEADKAHKHRSYFFPSKNKRD